MSRQGNKKESASGMDLLKSVDIVSNHLTWTPEGMDHPILKDITLTLEPGHIYGIIGPNGAGKSIIREKSLQDCSHLCRRRQILRQTLRQRRS